MNTGCLKIFKKAAQFDEYNTFIPPHRRGEDIQLFRGDDDDNDDDDDDDDDNDDAGDGLQEPGHQRDGRQALLPLRGRGRQAVRARPGAAQGYQHQGGCSCITGIPAAKYTSTRI